MASVVLKVGPKHRAKKVESVPILSGLVAHTAPDTDKYESLFNISHAASGLAVLLHIPEKVLPKVIEVLSQKEWDVDLKQITTDKEFFETTKEAYILANKKSSEKQEQRIADDLGGRRQPASGARWGYRRDVITPEFLIEAKVTDASSFRISDKDLAFLKTQAYKMGRVPIYIVQIKKLEDAVMLPTAEVPEKSFNPKHRKVVDRSTKKSFLITESTVKFTSDAGAVTVILPSGYYTLLGYERFLVLAKRGMTND